MVLDSTLAAYNQVMLLLLTLLALVQTDPNDQARALIEKFRSDDVKVRDAATAELIKLGEPIRKTLETAAKDKDPEVGSRIRDVIKALDRAAIPHPWGSFKPGSFARLKSVTEMSVAGNQMKTEMTMTYTLTERTKEECTVETEMILANVPPQKHQMKVPLESPQAPAENQPPQKTGTEEIVVVGKKLKCTWTEIVTEAAGTQMTSRIWTHPSVPGHTVKVLVKSETMTHLMEVVEFSSK